MGSVVTTGSRSFSFTAGKQNESMHISRGKLATLVGCNAETIRYYESIGILPDPPRSSGGHRQYDEALRKRLSFVIRCRELGFPLVDIRALLKLVDDETYTCEDIKTITEHQLDKVRNRIFDLKTLERTLSEMASQCDRGDAPECPIIDNLFDS